MTENSKSDAVSFVSHHSSFQSIVGSFPRIVLLKEDVDGRATFHEACIYHAATKSVFVTSNQIPLPNGQTDDSTSNKKILVTRVYDHDDHTKVVSVDATPQGLVMPNGGINYKSGLLFCAQGNKFNSPPSGLVYIPNTEPPYSTQYLLSSFHGKAFNSINDAIVHRRDGSIWFTDPCYGYHQGIRPQPELPCQVYRFHPDEGSVRAVADDFVRPNGLCFSPDLKQLYVTDTGAVSGAEDVPFDQTGKSSIYAFDILETNHGMCWNSNLSRSASAYFCNSRTVSCQSTSFCICRIWMSGWHQMRYQWKRLQWLR